MKKIFFFFSILVLAVEFPIFSLAGKDIKLWMIFSLVVALLLLVEIFKQGFSLILRSRIFYLGVLIIVSALLALLNSPQPLFSANQILVLAVLMPLAVFWEINLPSLKKEGYSALATGMLFSCVYAIYQNWAFDRGWPHFEVMAARPNALFYEPDWLGFYLALGLMPFLHVLIFKKTLGAEFSFFKHRIYLLIFNIFVLVGLLLTAARSGWLAAIAGFMVMAAIYFLVRIRKSKSDYLAAVRLPFLSAIKLLIMVGAAYSLVFVFGLSRFDLPDRFRSIFFREHVITLALNEANGEKIKINLEEREDYAKRGYKIIEEYIKDENVSSREEKAANNVDIIKKHPILGSGPGINQILTNYEHNANNLFLEWWSGWGLLSLIGFVGFLLCLTRSLWTKESTGEKKLPLVLGGLAAFAVVNLFNASNLLAFAWFYLAWLSSMVDFSWTFKKNR